LDERRRSLVATSLGHFINDGLTGVLPLMYPVFVAYDVSVQIISVLTFLQSALSIVVSPFVGRISDIRGNFADMIALGLVIFAIGAAGYAVSTLFSQGAGLVVALLLFTIMIGVGSSFYHPLGATVLRAKWPASDLGRALGINGSVGGIGRIAMPFAAAVIIARSSLPSTSLLAGLSIVGTLVILVTLRGVKFASNKARTKESLLQSLLPPSYLARRLSTLTVVSFSRGLFTGVLPFIPLYLTQVDHLSPLQAGFLYSGMLGVTIPSTILFGVMQDRWGSRISLAFSNLGGVITLFLFIASSNPILVDTSLLLFGFFSYSAFSLLLGMVHDLTEFDEMTSAGSIVWGIGNNGGSAAAPLLVGLFALPSLFGTLTAGFLAAAAIGVVSVVLMPLVPATHKSAIDASLTSKVKTHQTHEG
jgi:FSR family fosmidomycin resistance protein-like MFS transporter